MDNFCEACGCLSRARLAGLKLDPAGVEAVQHLYAGNWILHPLLAKESFPAVAGYCLHAHIAMELLRQSGRHLVGRYAARPFYLDHSLPFPGLTQQLRDYLTDILRSNHGKFLVKRLKKTWDNTVLLRGRDVPANIFHEPCRPDESC